MTLIVQKFGGTSVQNDECLKTIVKRIQNTLQEGVRLVVVVSARAGVTNGLIQHAKSLVGTPHSRELDMLLSIGEQETAALLGLMLQAASIQAVALTGWQAGIITDARHGNARILQVDPGPISSQLEHFDVVVVTGFQGVDLDGNITTLGRGGSDLTALALSHALQADRCEIFTDVDGVFTGDPKVIPQAHLITHITSENLLRLSFYDNKIMQDRSVAFAQHWKIPFWIAHSRSFTSGTAVEVKAPPATKEPTVIGITGRSHLVLLSYEMRQKRAMDLLSFFQKNGVEVSFLKQHFGKNGHFLGEICLDAAEYHFLEEPFLAAFQSSFLFFNQEEGLSRIDIVGTHLQSEEKIAHVFSLFTHEKVFRFEYGKHGLSFLVSSQHYASLSQQVHAVMFDA